MLFQLYGSTAMTQLLGWNDNEYYDTTNLSTTSYLVKDY